MGLTDIKQLLPKDVYDAAIGANAPSASNVFATIADVGGITPSLSAVLAVGNTTGAQSLIVSAGGEIRIQTAGNALRYTGGAVRLEANALGDNLIMEAVNGGGVTIGSAVSIALNASFDVRISQNNFTISSNSNLLSVLAHATMSAPRTATFQDASGTVAFLTDIPATPALSAVLGAGNTTSGNNIIISAASGDVITYESGANSISISGVPSGGNFTQSLQNATGTIALTNDITVTAVAQTYTPTNVTTDRSYDANSTSLDELADVVGTLIADLQTSGIIL